MPTFDPNAAAKAGSGIFGLPWSKEESALVLVPIPWEVTTSYGGGTASGPKAILDASKQVDLYDSDLGEFYTCGISMLPESTEIQSMNTSARPKAKKIIARGGDIKGDPQLSIALKEINAMSRSLNTMVEKQVETLLDDGKIVGLVGGEHSTPFGAIKALLKAHPKMGVLQIDAHADLRKAFEGFEFSHASIMYNVVTKLSIPSLTQVGVRDFCSEEREMIEQKSNHITTFFDRDLSHAKFVGESWQRTCERIVAHLPQEIFVSFDIDGLDPSLCPHTGTPVPGGLSFNEANFLLRTIVESDRTIVGFDLNEVSPGENAWDSNVGARMLFKLCGWTLKSQKHRHF